MKEILISRGFQETESSNEFIRNTWVIRFYDEFVEAFNDPEDGDGKYYHGLHNKLDIETLLDEIDGFEL